MKKIFLLAFLPLLLQGHEVIEKPPEKVYLHPAEIALTNQDIFAYLGGQWIPIEGIGKDAKGLYVLGKNPYHHRWLCPTCHYNNNGWDKTCQREYLNGQKCGTARPWARSTS